MRINYKKEVRVFFFAFLFTCLTVLGFFFIQLPASAATGIYRTINFQGKVVNKTDSTNVANGSYTFVFKLYDADTGGGTQLPSGTPWSESQSLTVTNGVFRATLGSVTPLPSTLDFNSDSIWLDVTFNGETFGSRVRLTAVPYAFNAEKVSGLTVTNTTGTLTIANAKTVSFADAFTTSGAFPLTLTTTASTNLTLPTTGTLATLAGTEEFTNKTIGSTGLVFSGAATDITTASNENLILSPNGSGKVGILNSNPLEALDVTGSASFSGNVTIGNGSAYRSAYGPVQLAYKSGLNAWTTGLYLQDTTGNVGIGTNNPNYSLQVNGDFRVENRSYFNGLNSITLTSSSDFEAGYIHGEYGTMSFQPISTGAIVFLNSSNDRYFTFDNDSSRFGFGLNNNSPTEMVDILGNATASGNITLGGQLQVGRFGYDPISFGNGSISYNTSTNKFRCYQNGAWTDCIGAGGTPTWNSITDPGGNLALTMNSYTSTFTYGNATSTNNLFTLTDTASNTGTGYLFNLVTAAGSTLNPLRVRNGLTDSLVVDSNGRLGVGTSTNLTEAINVNGNFSFLPLDAGTRSLGVQLNTSGGGDGTDLDIFAGGGDLGYGGDLNLYAGTGGGPGGSVYIFGGGGTSEGDVILAHSGSITRGNVGIGKVAPTEKLDITGNASMSGYLTVGQAGGIRSQYGPLNFQYKSNQNAWTTGMVLQDSTGFLGLGNLNPTANLDISSSQTTGNALNLTANSLTSGNGFYLSSTATALTGDLLSLYLNPASASTITGDVLGINSGSNLTLSGYYLNIQNNGSAVFQVGQNQIISAVPHSFTAAGDVSMAYDLIFTNATASYIKSDAPFYVESGPVWGNNDLTLRTFNYGKVIADADTLYAVKDLGVGGSATISGQLRLGNYAVAPTAAGSGSLYYDSVTNKVYYYNGSAWTEMGAGTSSGPSVFQEAAGIIRPMNNTADVLFGGTATASAKFAFLNLDSGTPMLRIDNDSDNTNKGCFRYNGTSNQMEYSNDCSTFQGFSSSTGGGWTDDGTTVRLTTSTDNLGVGTATAPEKLTVSGNATASGNITMGGQMLLGRFGYDPTSLGNGSMYYNTTTNKFRCYENGAWANCVGGGTSLTSAFVLKGSNESVTNSTALQDDNELTFNVASGEQWYFHFDITFTTNSVATNDIRVAVNSSAASTTCTYGAESISHAGNVAFGSATACNTAMVIATTATGTKHAIVSGTVRGMTGSGAVVLRWAQGTLDATNATTVVAGSSLMAFKISGADLGEIYASKMGALEPGTVVSADSSLIAGVQPSTHMYDSTAIGVVSTKPGIVIGDANQMGVGSPVVVALSGRIPVKVSTESGEIHAGDYLTTSSTPGVAMKATQPGIIIGQALEDYNPEGNGAVLMFIKNGFYNGATAGEYTSDKIASYSLLNNLINKKTSDVDQNVIQQLVSDRIVGGLEIVAPEVITSIVSTNVIESQSDDMDIRISPTGELRIGSKTATDTATIRFDADGNAYFAGELSASRIQADSIEGLAEIATRIASLEAQIHTTSQSALLSYDRLIPTSTLSAVMEGLTLTRDATVGGKLHVAGSGLIEGVLNVIDTITSSNVVVSNWFTAMGKAIFHDNVLFMGRPTFNKDTGGFVTIKKGQSHEEVSFENEYDRLPVVNVSMISDKDDLETAFENTTRYIIGKRTQKGFVIQLEKPANEDITFSWTALSITDVGEVGGASTSQ